jgi:DNA ligase 1
MSKSSPPGSLAHFAQLFLRLDQSQGVRERQQALLGFLNQDGLADKDAAWALWLLAGERLKRTVAPSLFRKAMEEATGLQPWLVEECYQSVGDLAETSALLAACPQTESDFAAKGLADLIECDLLALRGLQAQEVCNWMMAAWGQLTAPQVFCLNKILTGGLRLGLSRQGLVQALADHLKIAKALVAQRMLIFLSQPPDAKAYQALVSPDDSCGAQAFMNGPAPFFLAQSLSMQGEPLEQAAQCEQRLGPIENWAAEWKWDGIRAQLVVDAVGQLQVWSRGEELVTEQFPEFAQLFAGPQALPALPLRLDGEILAWDGLKQRPFAFVDLQRRLGRRKPSKAIQNAHPVVFMAYDLLGQAGRDWRAEPFSARRAALVALLESLGEGDSDSYSDPRPESPAAFRPMRASPIVAAENWAELALLQAQARDQPAEGLMLKRWDAAYGQGRTKESLQGELWKWKLAPLTIDAVLVYAQRGHGRRAGLYTDYGFALWDDRQDPAVLVPFAKAYSGLTDAEIKKVDQVIRKTIEDKFGPVRQVRPSLVMELGFEAVMASSRHKSGIAVRFPRILRLRPDKTIEQADRLSSLRAMLS